MRSARNRDQFGAVTKFEFDLIEAKSNAEISARWRVPVDLVYLNGHFPNQPVVPAVTLMDAAVELLKTQLGPAAQLVGVKNAKFSSPLLPEQTVTFEAKLVTGGDWSIDLKTTQAVGSAETAEPQAIAKLLLTLAL